MTDRSFDRIADAYLADGPDVLPDRVFEAAFEKVHRTHQRRVLVRAPWRFPTMNTFAKLAVAAVAVIAVGLLGLTVLGPGRTGVGGAPSATPSASAEPSPSATVIPTPTPTPGQTAPPLSGRFTSEMHGFSMAYPSTWLTRPASEPWTSGFLDFGNVAADALYEPSNPGNIWLTVASQPLGGLTPAEWEADVWQSLVEVDPGATDCSSATQPVTIDGAAGVMGCNMLLVTDGGRGYAVALYVSGDDPKDAEVYDEAWFASVLATLELQPEDALDPTGSPAPS